MEALIKHILPFTGPPGLVTQMLEDRTQRIERLLLLADVQKIDEAIDRLLLAKQATTLKESEVEVSPDSAVTSKVPSRKQQRLLFSSEADVEAGAEDSFGHLRARVQ